MASPILSPLSQQSKDLLQLCQFDSPEDDNPIVVFASNIELKHN